MVMELSGLIKDIQRHIDIVMSSTVILKFPREVVMRSSCEPCGCDMGAEPPHYCERHGTKILKEMFERGLDKADRLMKESALLPSQTGGVDMGKTIPTVHSQYVVSRPMKQAVLPSDKVERKQTPIYSGVLKYFPLAIAEVARVSYVGNEQHNPGEPLHWAREKSTDQHDCIVRHLMEAGTIDTDGMRHSAKVCWRSLAALELELEAELNNK
jgi:hypothetical protein